MLEEFFKKYTVLYLACVILMNLGWFDCWTAPKIKLDISFLYHPVPIGGPAPQAEISTPEKENKLLSPLRVPSRISRSATRQSFRNMIDTFDPALLTADKCTGKKNHALKKYDPFTANIGY